LSEGKLEPQAPATVGPQHTQTRTFADPRGEFVSGVRGWERQSRLAAAWAKDQLDGGNPRYSAQMRYDAGAKYADIFAASQPRGKDSTQLFRANSSPREGAGCQLQADASRALRTIHSKLSEADARIVEMFCGKDHTAAEAVRAAHGDDVKFAVLPRLRSALDALAMAARKRP
jgi:hypothetical protein